MSAFEEKKGFWARLLSFFGGESNSAADIEAKAEERDRATKEKLAGLGGLIDVQIASLGVLENKWQMTCEGVEALVRERDERDAAFAGMLEGLREDMERLGDSYGSEQTAGKRRNMEMLKGIYEESRFYVGMADNLKDMLSSHKSRIDGMFASVKDMTASLGSISGITLEAAMLSARFGEDAAEFAAICDRIREQVSKVVADLSVMKEQIAAEQVAYEDTFDSLLNLTEQLFKNKDTITAMYEMAKEKKEVSDEDAVLYGEITGQIEEMLKQLFEAGDISKSIDKENGRLYAIRGEETQSRIEIESVAEEIHKMTSEDPDQPDPKNCGGIANES